MFCALIARSSFIKGQQRRNARATKSNKCTVEVLLAAGLRLREGASLEPADAPVVRHDSFRLASNLWGLLGSVRRKLEGLKGWGESA